MKSYPCMQFNLSVHQYKLRILKFAMIDLVLLTVIGFNLL